MSFITLRIFYLIYSSRRYVHMCTTSNNIYLSSSSTDWARTYEVNKLFTTCARERWVEGRLTDPPTQSRTDRVARTLTGSEGGESLQPATGPSVQQNNSKAFGRYHGNQASPSPRRANTVNLTQTKTFTRVQQTSAAIVAAQATRASKHTSRCRSQEVV